MSAASSFERSAEGMNRAAKEGRYYRRHRPARLLGLW